MRHRTWLALAALTLTAGCGGTDDASPSKPSPSSEAAAVGGLIAPEEVEKAGGDRLAVAEADWVRMVDDTPWMSLAGGTILSLDPDTGAVAAQARIGGDSCTAMEVANGELLAAVCSVPGKLALITPAAKPSVRLVDLGPIEVQPEGSVGASPGAAWVVTGGVPKQLLRVDLGSNRVARRFPVAEGVVAVRFGLGGLWLTDATRGALLRMNPATGKVLATISTGEGARFFDVGEGAVWVQNNTAGTVTRVDPATNQAVATIEVAPGPIMGGDLAVGGGFVWARTSDVLVAKIDPATNRVVARYGPARGSGSVAADENAAWISAHDVDAVYRLPLS